MELLLWYSIPILCLALIAYYIYRSILKRVKYFRSGMSLKKSRIISLVGMLLLMVPCINVFGIWTIILLHLVALFAISDFIFFILRKGFKEKEPSQWFLRIHYSGIIVIILTVAIIGFGYHNMFNVVATEYNVTTAKDIRAEGYKVVFITDLHYGISLSDEELSAEVDKINDAKPNVVILGGDIIDESTTEAQMKKAFSILGKIKATYGIYYIYGNHDKSPYTNNKNYTIEQLETATHKAGIKVLENEVETINDELTIIGRSDYGDMQVKRVPISKLIENVDESNELILVDHQPVEYDKANEEGMDVILSGHTHGGQIWPAGRLSELFKFSDKNYGYSIEGNLNEIVSSGIAGWGFPIRTERKSEYVILNIKH